MKPGAGSGFFVERVSLSCVTARSFLMNDRTEIEARFLKAAAALLHAYKKAAAAFEKRGFILARSFKTKQPRGHKNKAALSTTKKAVIRTKFHCTRAAKPQRP
jgi:hypothetical protein